jgi:hypothetical protein
MYAINGKLTVFLEKRAIFGKEKPGATRCEECCRGFYNAGCLFCSLRYKVRK